MGNFNDSYQKRVEYIISHAAIMKRVLAEPFRTDNGDFVIPKTETEVEQKLKSAIAGSVYANFENGTMIAAEHARALQDYESLYGHLPSDELLASAYNSLENANLIVTGKMGSESIFTIADVSTPQEILRRDKFISLGLPALLQSITSNIVTYIPGGFNQSNVFRISRVAGSAFGKFAKGDIIDFAGELYFDMNKMDELGKGDGSKTVFEFKSAERYGVQHSIKERSLKIIVDRAQVAADTGNYRGKPSIQGSFPQGGETIIVSGLVNYDAGAAEIIFSKAPAADVELHIGFDVDIEKAPHLIPCVDHREDPQVLYPHERAIGIKNINADMRALRNILAEHKDRKPLHDMMFYASRTVEWACKETGGFTLRERETLYAALLQVDAMLMEANGVSGMIGLVAGTEATNIFRAMPTPFFVAAPGYHNINRPHYVGRVFGLWDLYCDHGADNGWDCLCYAKGPEHGQAAYVAGDVLPALPFSYFEHGNYGKKTVVMRELAYRDMQPFDGEKYLAVLKINPSAEMSKSSDSPDRH